jgi:hypothetical protein
VVVIYRIFEMVQRFWREEEIAWGACLAKNFAGHDILVGLEK